uniref:cob(I)yrinic acid a,c-diamide adenosyltransferase n=1 Tax=Alistipes sp. TaxID=1872444 RepID=UPI0040565305
MKIYTKTGDKGTTSLIGGERVSKTDLRVEAYGTVDELIAHAALLGDKMRPEKRLQDEVQMIDRINSQLMTLSALLACGRGSEGKVAPIPSEQISWLEKEIDRMSASLPEITKFTIPGGSELLSMAHICRTICRRAERAALRAEAEYGVEGTVLSYLNRLSDLYYTLGRYITHTLQIEELLWIP